MTAFIDSNILICAYSDSIKRPRALDTIAGGGIISAQVLNEFTNVLRNKLKQDWPIIEAAIRSLHFRFPNIVPLTADTHAQALEIARDHGFSFYDALIIAAAIESQCDTLWSEDLQRGRLIGGVTIRNPFADETS